jgi:acyl-CoA thioester hydrolase
LSRRKPPNQGPFRYRHPIEVRFGDTDALGHINNAIYLSYFEMGRSGYYRLMTGIPFGTEADADRYTTVLSEATVHYRSQAFYGEPLVVECGIGWATRTAFAIEYRVLFDGSPLAPARLVADGTTVHVRIDITNGRVTRLPADLRAQFEAFEGHPIPEERPA